MTKVPPPATSIEQLSPMLLDERKRAPENEQDYIAELKYDGYRVLAQFGDAQCTLRTRNGADCTRWFPEVEQSLRALAGRRCIVDGEMCVLDEMGRTDFNLLHERARHRRWRPGDVLVTFCVFDVLVVNGRSVMHQPLTKRKSLLLDLFDPAPPQVLVARHIDAIMVPKPVSWLYGQAVALQLEGVVGKLASSRYQPGARTPDWFKLKRPGAVPAGRFRRGS
jgi:bifunctional non-homologous end joining protein LigD